MQQNIMRAMTVCENYKKILAVAGTLKNVGNLPPSNALILPLGCDNRPGKEIFAAKAV